MNGENYGICEMNANGGNSEKNDMIVIMRKKNRLSLIPVFSLTCRQSLRRYYCLVLPAHSFHRKKIIRAKKIAKEYLFSFINWPKSFFNYQITNMAKLKIRIISNLLVN